jgi:hypothetical protein
MWAIVAEGTDVERFATPNVVSTASNGEQATPLGAPLEEEALRVSLWLDDAAPSTNAAHACRAARAFRFDEGVELFRNLRGLPSEAVGLPDVTGFVFRSDSTIFRAIPLPLPSAQWSPDQPADAATTWHVTFTRCPNLTKIAILLDGVALVATYPVTSNELASEGRLMLLGPPPSSSAVRTAAAFPSTG